MKMGLFIAILIVLAPSLVLGQAKPSLPNVTSEVSDAIVHLQSIDEEDIQFIRFFTTYAIPEDLREKAVLTLSFVIHSLVGLSDEGDVVGYSPLALQQGDEFKPLRLVDGSQTLWWIDLRDYNWTEVAWERTSLRDGYFVEPAVEHDKNGLLRLLVGNAVLRADWFIVHATNVAKQADTNQKGRIYNDLLYAKTKEPKNIDDWRKLWGRFDLIDSRNVGNEYGALVTKSQQVSRHNRFIFGYKTILGWMYESYDVLNQEGLRDYVENFPRYRGQPPTTSDAGEIFASNQLYMQVYAIRDAAGNIIDWADPTAVRHLQDVLGDARVRMASSCMDCHSVGPLPSENTIAKYLETESLKVHDKQDQLRIKRAFLENRFGESVSDNQILFARGLSKVNGLSPEQNGTNFLNMVKWYDEPVNLEQAALECGVTVEEFKQQVIQGIGIEGKVPGRIALLLANDEGIPRDVWETNGQDGIPGMFQQAMILLYGLTKITTEEGVLESVEILPDDALDTDISVVAIRDTQLKSGTDTLAEVRVGEVLTMISSAKEQDGWIFVKNSNEIKGWVWKNHVR